MEKTGGKRIPLAPFCLSHTQRENNGSPSPAAGLIAALSATANSCQSLPGQEVHTAMLCSDALQRCFAAMLCSDAQSTVDSAAHSLTDSVSLRALHTVSVTSSRAALHTGPRSQK